MVNKMIKFGAALILTLGVAAPGLAVITPSQLTQASEQTGYVASDHRDGTYTVAYQVNKSGTTQPSLSNQFFTGKATVVVKDAGQKTTVTLHLQKYANMIKSFKIGDQEAKVTNATDATADLTFAVDEHFAQPTVTATMNVLNMNQNADIVFATALYAANETPATPAQPAAPTTPATTPAPAANAAADTQTVAYKVNKVGTTTPSLSNSFFTGQATVDPKQNTVTLHIQKYASMIKSFKIGNQTAKVTNATNATADLTFTLNADFAQATVTAAMNVLNMNQKADIVFAHALYQAPTTTPSDQLDPSTTPTTPATGAEPTTVTKPTTTQTPAAAQTQTAAVYQADDGQLTTQTSAAQAFLAKSATTVLAANGQTTQVTLHTTGAQYIDQMKLLDQVGRVVNHNGNEADIVFELPTSALKYALPATFDLTILGGMKMTQSAFVLIGLPIAHAQPYLIAQATTGTDQATTKDTSKPTGTTDISKQPAVTTDSTKTPVTTDSTKTSATTDSTKTPATPDANQAAQTPPTTDPNQTVQTPPAASHEVAYTIKKAGSDQLSLSNSFFTGSATVTGTGRAQTVTLHLQKFASMVKSFSIGTQAAKITNATANTADLTFTIDASFAQPKVSASMNVLNMTQKADIVFSQALYTSLPATDTTPSDQPDQGQPAPATDDTTAKPDQKPAQPDDTATKTADHQTSTPVPAQGQQATIKVYQAIAGQLSPQPSAAQAFLADLGQLQTNGATTQVTIHTTGAEFIDQMRLCGQVGQERNRNGNEADLIFTIPTSALQYALPATFQLTIPGGVQMTQAAFVLIDLGIANARPYPAAPAATPKQTVTAVTHHQAQPVLDAAKTVQYVPYTVWDQSQKTLSTANNYFTHTAKVVKVANGYDVYLTVQETAGMVAFKPLTVNHAGIFGYQKVQANGQDIWTYAFHIAQAATLTHMLPATILMSVPIAGINGMTFSIWLEFNHTQVGGANYEQAAAGSAALPATTIPLVAAGNNLSPAASVIGPASQAGATLPHQPAAKPQATVTKLPATHRFATQAADQKALPKVKSYPFLAEIGGFAAVSLVIIGLAIYKRQH